MDIVKFFETGRDTRICINVMGTDVDPLFQASQIGALLELTNIRGSIRDFDEDERVTCEIETVGGTQSITCLTDRGLFRLLGQSRKPIARPFQKWVANVIREIRINGQYQMQSNIEEQTRIATRAREDVVKALEDATKARENEVKAIEDQAKAREDAARARENQLKALEDQAKAREEAATAREEAAKARENEARIREEAARTAAELEFYRNFTYEEVMKNEFLYINKEKSERHTKTHKIGKSRNPNKRCQQAQTASAKGVVELYRRACVNAGICEKIVEVVLGRYHITSGGGTEHYNNNFLHSKNVLDFFATCIDIAVGMRENITRKELFDKIIAQLIIERDAMNHVSVPYWDRHDDAPTNSGATSANNEHNEESTDGLLNNSTIAQTTAERRVTQPGSSGAVVRTPIPPTNPSAAAPTPEPRLTQPGSSNTVAPIPTPPTNPSAAAPTPETWLKEVIEITGEKKTDRVHFTPQLESQMFDALKMKYPTVQCDSEDFMTCIKLFIVKNENHGSVWKNTVRSKNVDGSSDTYNNVAWGVKLDRTKL